MKNKKIKCDIYTRVSTTMQVDGYSLDAQKEKLKRYAEFQNMEIVNEYSDEGKSGKSVEGRPEFQRMLENIENGTDEVHSGRRHHGGICHDDEQADLRKRQGPASIFKRTEDRRKG